MAETIQISPETYRLLQRRAALSQATPTQLAEMAIRLHLGNTAHIEQKQTRFGPQAYLRGTRVAVRHVATFLKAGHSVEEIINTGLPQVTPAAIYEAIAYYYDHQDEIEVELSANDPDIVKAQLQSLLSPADCARITGQAG